MSSSERAKANRRNAQKSTGPKTAAGKRKVAGNALSHGLAVPVACVPELGEVAERLARRLAGDAPSPARLQAARRVAEAQADLARIRQAKMDLLAQPMANPTYRSVAEWLDILKFVNRVADRPDRNRLSFEKMMLIDKTSRERADPAGRAAAVLADLSHRLAVIDRYERRALSRRKAAIRDFDTLS